MGRFQKGKPRPKSAGRKKGTPNKVTIAAKLAMLEAFAHLGAVDGLVRWARSKRPAKGLTEFYKLWSKTLPREISGPDGGPIPFADLTDAALDAELARLKAQVDGAPPGEARPERPGEPG